MKAIGNAILAGILAVLAAWVFLAVFPAVFNGIPTPDSYVVGTCFFLAFEIALCTGLILSKLNEGERK